ncbi:MAG: restriction endonuclease [Candidatus Nanopelagicales bacterium]
MTTRPLVQLIEYGPSEEVDCQPEQAVALLATGLVDVRPTIRNECRTLVPGGKVGAVRVGDLEVHVSPKVEINRVLFLLEYAPDRPSWHLPTVNVAKESDLLSAVATVFAHAANRATRSGLLQGYREREESLTVFRGRLREGDQLRLQHGRPLPVEVRYDDFTVDITENQLLLSAVSTLLRLPMLPTTIRRSLTDLRHRFVDVTGLVRGIRVPQWKASRLNVRYHPALHLADLILAGSSFEHRAGELSVSGLVLDMPKVFEDFLTKALTDALREAGGQVVRQPPTWLDEEEAIRTYPDIVWLRDDRPRAVVDAKYKAEKNDSFPNADLYQALAYATVLDLPEAHLVYAQGHEAPREHTVRHSGIRITTHVLDLSLPPRALLEQVDRLALLLSTRKRMALDQHLPSDAGVAV